LPGKKKSGGSQTCSQMKKQGLPQDQKKRKQYFRRQVVTTNQ
ncbi:14093_t:CDS:1, partial [Racocetra persica]